MSRKWPPVLALDVRNRFQGDLFAGVFRDPCEGRPPSRHAGRPRSTAIEARSSPQGRGGGEGSRSPRAPVGRPAPRRPSLTRIFVLTDGADIIDSFRKSAGKADKRRGAAIVQHVRIPFLPRRKRMPRIREFRQAGRELDHADDQAQRRSTSQLISFARGSQIRL